MIEKYLTMALWAFAVVVPWMHVFARLGLKHKPYSRATFMPAFAMPLWHLAFYGLAIVLLGNAQWNEALLAMIFIMITSLLFAGWDVAAGRWRHVSLKEWWLRTTNPTAFHKASYVAFLKEQDHAA